MACLGRVVADGQKGLEPVRLRSQALTSNLNSIDLFADR
jgi:hypothetical protein